MRLLCAAREPGARRIPGVAVNEVSVGAAKLTTAQEPAPADDTIGLAIAALAKAGYTAHLES